MTNPRKHSLIGKHPRTLRLLIVSIVILSLFGGYVWRYQRFIESLRAYDIAVQDGFASQEFPFLDQHQITQLGQAHRPGFQPTSSYTQFKTTKRKDGVRIGIFGCSFVKGSEAGPGQDFPSHLQRLFEEQGHHDVEVLNFGVGAFGVQQSYLLWQYLGARFNLDYTIYNLYGFHRERDNTFVMLNTIYAPVHARYVLDDGGLRLIEVQGQDRREASADYFRLVPRYDYLRYDAKTPPQIRALLPTGRELKKNPFYYRKDKDRETVDLYAQIFADMARGSDSFHVLLNDKTSESIVRSGSPADGAVNSIRTSTEKYTWDRRSFFRAPKNHPSALGYYVQAIELNAFLTAKQEVWIPDIEILESLPVSDSRELTRDLSVLDDVFVSFDGEPAAVFVSPLEGKNVRPYSFEAGSKNSLVDVSGGRTAMFIALRGPVPRDTVWLSFSAGGTPVRIEVGTISFVRGRYIGVLDRSWSSKTGHGWQLVPATGGGAITLDLISEVRISEVRLEIGESTALIGTLKQRKASGTQRISWKSAEGDLLTTRGHPLQNATEIAASGGGVYCVTGTSPDQQEATWCTRQWRLQKTDLRAEPPKIPIIREYRK